MEEKMIGFTGARKLSERDRPLVQSVVMAVENAGQAISVGCQRGADEFVRAVAKEYTLFEASDYGQGKQAFATRSQAMVKAVATSNRPGLIGFVTKPSPVGIFPDGRWRSGKQASGSWSTIAFAIGLGLPTIVFCCGEDNTLPAWPNGRWVVAGDGIWAQGWRWISAPTLV